MLLVGGARWRDAVHAQQKPMPVIGYLEASSPGSRSLCGRVPPGTERDPLCRGKKRGDRIPLGGGPL